MSVDWDFEMEIDKNDVNLSTDRFFSKMNTIIDKHIPIKKVTAKECKEQLKPWITPTIIAKINTKNKLHKKIVKSKSRETQLKFNKIKNEITSLTRINKEIHYKKYFDNHSKDSKKIWNGIKEIINLKQKSSTSPTSLIDKKQF